MPLKEYRKKRRFDRTSEPSGSKAARSSGNLFVVQKHAASHLHYDFRLELDGTLKSWAVPKGPSLDPSQKRLAVEVEDHPIEYGDFEGTIPAGEYGGGTVMLWDRGSWKPEGNAREMYRSGHLKFILQGDKLSGSWALVRTRQQRGGKNQWLLIKHRDAAARPVDEFDLLAAEPNSVKTGRSMEEITSNSPPHRRVRRNGATRKGAATLPRRTAIKRNLSTRRTKSRSLSRQAGSSRTATPGKRVRRGGLLPSEGAVAAPMPTVLKAQLATLVEHPPEGDDWLHEIKLDGYRMFLRIDGDDVRLITRNDNDWTDRFPGVVTAAKKLAVDRAVLDGELVILDEHGVSQFQLLQNAMQHVSSHGHSGPILAVFDLIYLNGYDLKRAPLESRKSSLEALLKNSRVSPAIQYSEHTAGNGEEFYRSACSAGLEGVVSKRRDSPYSAERGMAWLKSKCRLTQELVIVGYTNPQGARTGFGSLLLGYYQRDGKLVYAGRVGTGFSAKLLDDLYRRLRAIEHPKSPLDKPATTMRTSRDVHWVKPQLVAQVQFSNWTEEGLLRQASFQGLREDKPAREVRQEKPAYNRSRKRKGRKR